MSRRQHGPPRSSGQADPGIDVEIMCAGRSPLQHRVRLGVVTVWPDRNPAEFLMELDVEGHLVGPPMVDDYLDTHFTYPISCSRCGIDIPMRRDTLEARCLALAKAGESRLNIAAIRG